MANVTMQVESWYQQMDIPSSIKEKATGRFIATEKILTILRKAEMREVGAQKCGSMFASSNEDPRHYKIIFKGESFQSGPVWYFKEDELELIYTITIGE